jgi:hypothetical protein
VVPFNDSGLRFAASAALIGDPKARSADRELSDNPPSGLVFR